MQRLRQQRCFRDARIVFIPEANLGNDAQYVSKMVLRHVRAASILCAEPDKYGVYTTPGCPERYVLRLNERLYEKAVHYHQPLLCVKTADERDDAPPISDADRAQIARAELEEQLGRFRKVWLATESAGQRVGVRYTGKVGHDGKRSRRLRDDGAMSLMLGFYWYGQSLIPGRMVLRTRNNQLLSDPLAAPGYQQAMSNGVRTEVESRDHLRRQQEIRRQPMAILGMRGRQAHGTFTVNEPRNATSTLKRTRTAPDQSDASRQRV